MTTSTGTLVRSPLAGLLAFHAPAGHSLPFGAATVAQAASRARMARLTVMSRTWAALRSGRMSP